MNRNVVRPALRRTKRRLSRSRGGLMPTEKIDINGRIGTSESQFFNTVRRRMLACSFTWSVFAALVIWPGVAAAGTPVPTYGTYFGGTADINVAVAVAVGPSGEVVIAGYTTSQSLPGTAHAFQPLKATGFPNNRDVFIAKFDPSVMAS